MDRHSNGWTKPRPWSQPTEKKRNKSKNCRDQKQKIIEKFCFMTEIRVLIDIHCANQMKNTNKTHVPMSFGTATTNWLPPPAHPTVSRSDCRMSWNGWLVVCPSVGLFVCLAVSIQFPNYIRKSKYFLMNIR